MNNRFNLLDFSEDEDETKEVKKSTTTFEDSGYDAGAEETDDELMMYDWIDGETIRRPMTKNEIYRQYMISFQVFGNKIDGDGLIVNPDSDRRAQKFDLNLVNEYQMILPLRLKHDVTKVISCTDYCCSAQDPFYHLEDGLYPEIISRALIRIQDLMKKKA